MCYKIYRNRKKYYGSVFAGNWVSLFGPVGGERTGLVKVRVVVGDVTSLLQVSTSLAIQPYNLCERGIIINFLTCVSELRLLPFFSQRM